GGHGEAHALECTSRLGCSRTRPPTERRPDQIGETFQNVDPHGTFAANPISDGAVKRTLHLLVDGKRGATARCEPLQLVEALDTGAAMLERPKLCCQGTRRRFEQKRDIYVIGAEAHPMFAQDSPQSLIETFEIVSYLAALQNAKRLHELVGNAAG